MWSSYWNNILLIQKDQKVYNMYCYIYPMTDRRRNIFDWNHISDKLTEDQIKELKAYYPTYHRKSWAHKQAVKRFKRLRILVYTSTIVFMSGGIARALASGGTALVAMSTI